MPSRVGISAASAELVATENRAAVLETISSRRFSTANDNTRLTIILAILTQVDKFPAKQAATILLVEDQAAVRMLAEDILGDAGHKVLSAANGRAALQIAEAHHEVIDVLITDVIMPEMNGPELAAHLLRARPHLAVLYISGY